MANELSVLYKFQRAPKAHGEQQCMKKIKETKKNTVSCTCQNRAKACQLSHKGHAQSPPKKN